MPNSSFTDSITADTSQLADLRSRLESFLAGHEVGSVTTQHAVLAVDEAAANAIEHSKLHPLRIEVRLELDEKCMRLEVSDHGDPFDPSAPPKTPLPAQRTRRGYGLHLIHRVVDELKYERTSDGRNLLRMVKFRDRTHEPSDVLSFETVGEAP